MKLKKGTARGWFRINGKIVKELADGVSSAGDTEAFAHTLDLLALQVREMIGAHQSAVSFIPDGDFTRAIHATSFSDKYAKYREYDVLPTGKGIWAVIFEECRSMRLTEKELYSHQRFKHFSDLKTKSGLEHPPLPGWLAIPVKRTNGDPIGVLQLSDKNDGQFTQLDQESMEYFSKLVSASFELEYARLEIKQKDQEHHDLKENIKEIKLLHALTNAISTSKSSNDALKKCLDYICEEISWPVGHIYMPGLPH